MTVRLGEQVPDVSLARPEGGWVALSSLLGTPLLLVFLRHPG
jgi:peroxiredoxin